MAGHKRDSDWAGIYNLVKVEGEYEFAKIQIIVASNPCCQREIEDRAC